MPSTGPSVIEHRRHAFGEARTADIRFRQTVADDEHFVREREARILARQAELAKQERPAQGIAPRRETARPIVVLTLPAPNSRDCRMPPSLAEASQLLGPKDCSICEAIRQRRPTRWHVFRYADQFEQAGSIRDRVFYPAEASTALLFSRW